MTTDRDRKKAAFKDIENHVVIHIKTKSGLCVHKVLTLSAQSPDFISTKS